VTAEQLAEHVRRGVDDAPPLSPAQRERLALLLAPAADAGLVAAHAA
jgi:hypothetical protein